MKFAALSIFLPVSVLASSTCSPLSFAVTASAQNVMYLNPPSLDNRTAVGAFLHEAVTTGSVPENGTHPVTGTFKIEGNYCVPAAGVKPRDVLQVLVHGDTYNKTYYSGLGRGSQYSWEDYATSKGYSTLAIDSLGHGDNSHNLDALEVIEGPLIMENLHAIIQSAKTTAHGVMPRFSKVVYVGHSYGSLLGNLMATTYPTSSNVDAFILTGFSSSEYYPPSLASGIVIAAGILPKFSQLSYGYLTIANETVRTSNFYGPAGAYNPQVAAFDFEHEDTSTLGENTSPGLFPAMSSYPGPVLVATADHDAVFCSTGPADCANTLQNTKSLFPKATKFDYVVIPDAGHCWALHYSAQKGFELVHSWLSTIFAA